MYKILLSAAALVASTTAQFRPNSFRFSQIPDPLYGGPCDSQGILNCQTQQFQGKTEAAGGCVQINGGGPNCVTYSQTCAFVCPQGFTPYQKVNSDDTTCVCG